MRTHVLNDQQIAHYHAEGYVVAESVLDADDLALVDRTIRQITDDAFTRGDYGDILEVEPASVGGAPVPRRLYDPFERHETFRRLAMDDRVLDRIESLIGPNIMIQHSKLNMKPAKVGSVVEWHQDLSYFPHTNDDLVSMLIYLDDATEENGCLQVLPRHHHHFFRHTTPDGTFAGMITENLGDGRFGRPVALAAPAGSIIFMHCMTPHSSLPNRSPRPRRTLIFEYRAADAFPVYTGPETVKFETVTHLLRGQRAAFARMAGPAQIVPCMPGDTRSLYQLQERTKSKPGNLAEDVKSLA